MDSAIKERTECASDPWVEDQCDQLFRKWKLELDAEEKQVWLWNSMVAMKRIVARRERRRREIQIEPFAC
jgi:hypothetical protein